MWIIERIVESAYGREMIEIRVVLVTRLLGFETPHARHCTKPFIFSEHQRMKDP